MTVAFHLPGDVPIFTYPLILGAGATLGLLWVAWRTQEHGFNRLDAGLLALLGALAGGRLGFAALNWVDYESRAGEILQLYRGGLAWPGAAVGALLALVLFSWRTRTRLSDLFDDLLPLLATISISAWLGCWLDGCAYGPLAPNNWWGIPSRDLFGTIAPRWPTQFFGAILTLALFWSLDLGRMRLSRPGLRASLGFSGLFLLLFALSFLRSDPAPDWFGARIETWVALILAGVSLLFLARIGTQVAPDEPDPAETVPASPTPPADPREPHDRP